jgi:hypothetical protein
MSQVAEFDWLNWLLNLVLAYYIGSFIWEFLKKYFVMVRLFDIEKGNQNELIHYVTISKQQLENIQTTYQWESYDEYDNRVTEYMELLFDNLTQKHKGKEFKSILERAYQRTKSFGPF